MSARIFSLILCTLFVLVKCESDDIVDLPQEFLDAKSPMESKFNLQLMSMNFPGLYDNVFAGIEARIAGGETTSAEKFPHQVLMYMVDNNGSNFICGGSLLTHEWVLTAAHCLHEFSSIAVFLGVTDRVNGPAAWSGNVTSRSQLIIHPKYIPTSHANDIGLIRLVNIEPSILDHKDVETIALPLATEVNVNLVGMEGTVSGYGSTADTNKASQTLRFVTMPIITNDQCRMTFGNFIRDTNLCMSGSGGRSVCSGDSGGPLTVQISPGQIVQVGIVSFGHKHGCTLGHPGVFTRVTSYLNWIEGHVGKISRETSSTTVKPIGEIDRDSGDSASHILIAKIMLIIAFVTHLMF